MRLAESIWGCSAQALAFASYIHGMHLRSHTSPFHFRIYGAMNCLLYDHAHIEPRVLRSPLLPPPPENGPLHRSTLFGPTCDGADIVCRDVMMPQLRNGDWVLFPRSGRLACGVCARVPTAAKGLQSEMQGVHGCLVQVWGLYDCWCSGLQWIPSSRGKSILHLSLGYSWQSLGLELN